MNKQMINQILSNNEKTVFFTVGGPGAGKSFVLARDFEDLKVVSADNWKDRHADYDPKNPQALHAWSKIQVNKEFYRCLAGDEDFAYDGTGTNAENLIDRMLRATEVGAKVVLVYVRCSLNTALRRNAERPRIVPEEIVREKHALVNTSFRIASGYADDTIIIDNDEDA